MTLKRFGFELRRTRNVRDLYADVDRVLGEMGMVGDEVGDKVKQATVAHALQDMISKKNWFDVTTVNNLAELTHTRIAADRIAVYRSIHCMDWNAMLPEYRQTICAMLLDDFRHVLTAEL